MKDTTTIDPTIPGMPTSTYCGREGTIVGPSGDPYEVLVSFGGRGTTPFRWDELERLGEVVEKKSQPQRQRYVVEHVDRISATRVEMTARAMNQCSFRAVLPISWSVPVGAVITLTVEPINEGVASE